MDLHQYFAPYVFDGKTSSHNDLLSGCISFFDKNNKDDIYSYDIFIFGVPEGRLSIQNETCAFAPDEIRSSLYTLYKGGWSKKVIDLGNLMLGDTIQDTYIILQKLTAHFIEKGKIMIVLGGGHDLITPIYKGYCAHRNPLYFASADAYLDFQDNSNFHSRSFLSELINSKEGMLSKYCLLGYQTYLCSPQELKLIEQMDFNLIRLGELNQDLKEMEPYLREIDHLSIDLAVLKSSEAPATNYSSPNGITAESLCVLLRYAGLSSRITSILLSELNPRLDRNSQSAKVYAQAIWYFIDGCHHRVYDLPSSIESEFKKFYVDSELSDLVFYKCINTERWWVDIPSSFKNKDKSFLPCSYSDYKKALHGEMSDRILKYTMF